jgi:hypothetical protein
LVYGSRDGIDHFVHNKLAHTWTEVTSLTLVIGCDYVEDTELPGIFLGLKFRTGLRELKDLTIVVCEVRENSDKKALTGKVEEAIKSVLVAEKRSISWEVSVTSHDTKDVLGRLNLQALYSTHLF